MASLKMRMMELKLKQNRKAAEEDSLNPSSLGSSRRVNNNKDNNKDSKAPKENENRESNVSNSKSKPRASSFREPRISSISGSETKESTISRSSSGRNAGRPRSNYTESPDSKWMTTKPKCGEKRQRQQLSSSSSESDSDSSLEAKPPSSQRGVVKNRKTDSSPEFSRSVSMSQSPINLRRQKDDDKMEEDEKCLGTPKNDNSTESQESSRGRPSDVSNDKAKTGTPICKRPTFKFNFKKKEESSSDESSDSDDDNAPAPQNAKPSDEAASSTKKKPSRYWGSSSDSDDGEVGAAPTKKEKTKTKVENSRKEKEDVSMGRSDSEDDKTAKPAARAMNNEDDNDDFMEKPKKKKTKKKGRAKNPFTIQAEEQIRITECRNKNLEGNLGGRDDLWSTDEEERARTQSQGRRRGRGRGRAQPARRPRPNLRDDENNNDDDRGMGQQLNVGGGGGGAVANAQPAAISQPNRPPVAESNGTQEDDPSIDSDTEENNKRKGRSKKDEDNESDSEVENDSEDEVMKREIEEMKRKEHPNLTNPTFGPFDNVPLPLVNKESNSSDHFVPASLARYLPLFQREGISFIYNAVVTGQGAILGDDMGLGKTLQVISLIAALLGKTGTGQDYLDLKERKEAARDLKREADNWFEQAMLGNRRLHGKDEHIVQEKKRMGLSDFAPILIIVPASVVDNWDYEFTMWGYFSVAVYREEKRRDEALIKMKYGEAEIMVCGHSSFSIENQFKYLKQIKWKMIVVDEFHEFKNHKGNLSKHLMTLKNQSQCPVLGMTGTPMQNRYEELHNLVRLIDPHLLGEKIDFMNRIGRPIMNGRSASATKEVQELGEERLSELKTLLQPMYIQRYKTTVLKDLPKKIEEVVLCPLSEDQKSVYQHILNLPDFMFVRGSRCPCDCGVNVNYFVQYRRLRTKAEKIQYQRKHDFVKRAECCYKHPTDKNAILWKYQHEGGEGQKKHDEGGEPCRKCPYCLLLPCLSMLYKLSSDLSLLQYDRSKKNSDDDDKEKREAFSKVCFPKKVLGKLEHIGGTDRCVGLQLSREQFFMMSGKIKKLHELLKQIENQKGRVLLFSYSTQTLDVIQEFLTSESYGYLRIDGSTPSKERQGLVNEFQTNDDHFVFLLSTKAAGVGLNLTAANNVIIFDAEWNPALDEQAQDRSWRIGQKRQVTVYRLIAQGTIDESRYLRQVYKSHLKQETFRADDGDEKKAAPRAFVGVEKDKTRRGELFGLENLLKFSPNSSFMKDTFKVGGGQKKGKKGSNELVAGKSDDIAKALADKKGDEIMEEEDEKEMSDEIEKAANKVLGTQQDQKDTMSESPMSESQAEPEMENIVRHADLFQNSTKLAFDNPDEVMGGQSQTVDELVCRRNDKGDELSEDDSEGPQENPEGRRKIPLKKPPKTNFVLCGKPVFQLKDAKTTFSMADIHQPRSARKKKRSRKGLW